MIHHTVIFGENVEMGDYVKIEKNVTIGDNVVIGEFVVIKEGTEIGSNVIIGDLSIVGKKPVSNNNMSRKPNISSAALSIGDGVIIGCNTVLFTGTAIQKDAFIGDLASIREKVVIGEASIIGRNAIIEMNTMIGRYVTIQTGAYITADMIIEDNVFIGPCCSTSNDKYMGIGNYKHQGPIIRQGAKIGNNATLLPGITIGKQAIVGAGSVVTKSVPDKHTVVGNPAISIYMK
ncbi:N-acetyltransferase [Paucisalibacillus globulus]|uniref:N-acetyltransferase n=1 Tax=Paucisalibacillus globulus TaxID=351095 RepID=UPI0003F51897|nr:N-acetyltransferase [Paucisalibacillus globulus]